MKKILASCAAALVATGGLLTQAPAAHAGDYECREALGDVTIVGNLLVPDDATCTLTGTDVQGSIVVKSRANLDATGVTVTGGLQGESPASVVVQGGSSFGNGVSLRKAEDVNDPAVGKINISNATITGDLALEDNREPIDVFDNDIVGSVQANKNTGELEISKNRIGNGLQCQDNNPPPVGGANIAKQKQGQCQFL